MLTELETALAKVTIEEETLVFDSFTGADAWELGQILVQLGKNAQMPVAVNISACGRQLFHYSFDGASPDNDNWIIRKQNVVLRFLKSSWRMALQLKLNGTTYPERYGISSEIYAASGGAFPITVRNVGVIGAVTVSGLKDYEDHDLVVAAINIFLEKYPNR